ncbi:multidrug resistance-associated protein 1 isoform X2 [Anthonomus grandis grandis]|uniref:multidrug resistance-associated protein 1 isoform X2 n=1 Tax=Anthonomus grandis grandis TaxID=2921223 RepID=UPI0021657450|nr:multidrug resistance-associated protein 1 isoform X2 [Anthonomus grandis grandis]
MANYTSISTLDRFCGSEFWNSSLTWNNTDPTFTPCFEKTVLVWIPCLFLWLFSSLEIYYIANSKNKNIPMNWLNSLKLAVTGALCVLMLSDFITSLQSSNSDSDVSTVDIYTPLLKLVTFILSAIFIYYNKKHGLQTSGLLFIFWFLASLFGAPQFRTEIRKAQVTEDTYSYYQYISYLIYYPLVILMFLLNCFVDQPPRYTKYPKTKHPCPEQQSSFLSRLLFAWFDRMTWKGFRKPLEEDDLWDLNPDDSAAEIVPIFERHWRRTISKCERIPVHARAQFKGDTGQIDFVQSKKKEASVMPALIKSFGGMFLFGSSLKLFQDMLTFISPQILGLIITYLRDREGNIYTWRGPFYAVLMFAVATIQTLFLAQYFHRMFIVGMRIRTALVSTIYRKSLKISNKARKERTAGEIVNLMAVDAQKFMDITAYINMIWSAPLQICLAMYFLWQELGPSVLAGLAVMIILIPINGFIANKSKTLQIKQMKNKDERVKLMNELLGGIKVLKLYAWEPSFEAQVLKIRDKEIKVLKEAAYLNAGTSFIWSCAPFLVVLSTFTSFVLSSKENILTPEIAFKSLSLFALMSMPMGLLPLLLVYVIETYVSVKRINTFMNAEELDPDNVSHDKSEEDPLVIENGCFSWGEDPILKNINIRIPHKTLTAIVGPVGTGKSSLISAFLGEMDKISGRVNTYGSVAYVSQQAWIQNATLKDNITFGKPYDKFIYNKVIDACALKPDFDMLPAGDQTEIGEKGINLSGGQKQRVSLARAAYADAEVYFLDDPLSAVDANVGKHIFDKLLGPQGLLKNKTRILVTHGITYLPQTDKIFVVNNGEISENGTYQELLNKKGAFAEFLMQHTQEEHSEDEEESDKLGPTISEDLPRNELRKRSRSDSGSSALNGSLQRQKSVDSAKSHRKESKEKNGPLEGEKLIEAEKSETGSVSWKVYQHYLKSIGTFTVIATVVLNMLFQVFSIGSNVWLGYWSEPQNAAINDTNITVQISRDVGLGVYGALGIGQVIVIFLASLALYVGTLNASKKLHLLLLSNVMRAPCTTFFDVTPVGRILNRFSKDVDTLDTVLPMTLRGWISCLFGVIGTLVVTCVATSLFILVAIPIAILYYFIQRFYVATSRQLKRLESVSRSPIYSHFGETISGVHCIRAYGQQDRFIRESELKVDRNQICYYPSIVSNRWLAVRLEMIGNCIILFAALFAVLGESKSPALIGLSLTYCLQITQTLNWVVRMTSDVETNIVAVERIKEYAEIPQEAAWELTNQNVSKVWPERGEVAFKDYSVRYRPGLELVLKRLSFSVKGGEKVGIAGRTGAGKSSLTLSLFRIIEAAEGQINIDGVDVASLGLHTLRSRLTIIPQDAVLFSGSLRMNLDPFSKHTDEEIWKSLELAHLKQFVKGLSSNLNYEINEGGQNLSVGQRQLVCLARALLRKTKVLILDEATAAVDLETDDLIQQTIRTEFKDCTVLTIAHRLNTIMDSDRVIVLDKGQIAEFDTPSNLLTRPDSLFYGMCKDAGLA